MLDDIQSGVAGWRIFLRPSHQRSRCLLADCRRPRLRAAFTVREGETIFDIAHDLEAEQLMTSDEFLAVAQNPELIRDIAPRAKSLEGFCFRDLFPATASKPNGSGCRDGPQIQGRMATHRASRSSTRATGLEHGRPVISVVTLASLVERETPKPEERPLVAGAFENRLRHNIALQCDPTVIYALQDAGQYRASSPAPICIPVAIQHLCASRPAARPHRQSRRSLFARRTRSGKNGLLIFCG